MLLLREMEEDGSTPDVAAFNDALDTLQGAGQWEQASTYGISPFPNKRGFLLLAVVLVLREVVASLARPQTVCSRQRKGQANSWVRDWSKVGLILLLQSLLLYSTAQAFECITTAVNMYSSA